MSALDLHAFVSRSRAVVDSTPPTTGRETRTLLVDPFLETLGWDVHADSCVTDVAVDGTELEYVCSVDGVPALLVAVEPFGASLDKPRAVALLETMAWTGIDRAIYTDGRDFLLLAGTTDVERLACQLPSLADHESALSHYTRETVGQRLERHSREFVARKLAIERSGLVDDIVARLTSVTEQGEAYRTEFESATDRFVDQLVASFVDDREAVGALESGSPDVSIEFSESTWSTDEDGGSSDQGPTPTGDDYIAHDGADDSGVSEGVDTRSAEDSSGPDESESETATERESDLTDAADGNEQESDTEYVVRFFSDRGSVGAVGHSRSAETLVQAAEYLFERGLSGVTVPWSPDDWDDGRAILNGSSTHPDGSSMDDPRQLSNGVYLETGGTSDDHAARIEALVDRAGLRVMLTGDWE